MYSRTAVLGTLCPALYNRPVARGPDRVRCDMLDRAERLERRRLHRFMHLHGKIYVYINVLRPTPHCLASWRRTSAEHLTACTRVLRDGRRRHGDDRRYVEAHLRVDELWLPVDRELSAPLVHRLYRVALV